MNMLLGMALSLTIFSSLIFGIAFGYGAICLVLRLMSLRTRAAAKPLPAPQPQTIAAGGD